MGDGATATLSLRERTFDLLIADGHTPGNAELEVIRALPDVSATTAAIVTDREPSIKAAMDSVRMGVVCYMVKPVEGDDMISAVREGLSLARTAREIDATRDRLDSWCEDVERMARLVRNGGADTAQVSVDRFLKVTLHNLFVTLTGVKNLAEAVLDRGEKPTCRLLQCPREAAMMGAIREAVESLEKTKNAFKSKELGSLRRRLEDVLRSAEEPARHETTTFL